MATTSWLYNPGAPCCDGDRCEQIVVLASPVCPQYLEDTFLVGATASLLDAHGLLVDSCVTDDTGQCTLTPTEAGYYTVSVTRDDCDPAVSNPITVRCGRCLATVRVLDCNVFDPYTEEIKTIAGATVAYRSATGLTGTVTTDAQGTVTFFTDLPVDVTVSAPGRADQTVRMRGRCPGNPAADVYLFVPGKGVVFTVTDGCDGTPLADAEVATGSASYPTAADGTVTVSSPSFYFFPYAVTYPPDPTRFATAAGVAVVTNCVGAPVAVALAAADGMTCMPCDSTWGRHHPVPRLLRLADQALGLANLAATWDDTLGRWVAEAAQTLTVGCGCKPVVGPVWVRYEFGPPLAGPGGCTLRVSSSTDDGTCPAAYRVRDDGTLNLGPPTAIPVASAAAYPNFQMLFTIAPCATPLHPAGSTVTLTAT